MPRPVFFLMKTSPYTEVRLRALKRILEVYTVGVCFSAENSATDGDHVKICFTPKADAEGGCPFCLFVGE